VSRLPSEKLEHGPKCAVCEVALVLGKAIEVGLATLERAARSDDLPQAVDFRAARCGPCRRTAPLTERARA
jgi:thioredoxin 2